jgi:hypothetical protein
MTYDDGLRLRDLTDAEMHDVAGDPRVLAIQKARQQMGKRK